MGKCFGIEFYNLLTHFNNSSSDDNINLKGILKKPEAKSVSSPRLSVKTMKEGYVLASVYCSVWSW